MSYNPAAVILGPAYVVTRNKAFYSKGNIAVTPKLDTFDVDLATIGRIEGRELNLSYEIKLTPVGRLDALAVLWPYGIVNPGELVHAVTDIVSIDLSTNIVTVRSTARFRDGAPVRVKTFGTVPTGLSTSTVQYVHILSGTTLTFHDTEAHALANSTVTDISGAGTGLTRIIEQEYLKIIDRLGTQHLFHNAAVVASPAIKGSAGATLIGEVTFEAFRQFDVAATNAASIYTKSTGVSLDTSFDPADIITQAYTLAWGSTAPWDSIRTVDGVDVSFPLSLEALGDDTVGLVSRKITEASAQFSCRPIGISEDDINTKLNPQNSGAGRGRRLISTDNLLMSGTSMYAQLYGAFLDPSTLNWDRSLERVAQLTWRPTRTFTTGAHNPLYYVGATAPA